MNRAFVTGGSGFVGRNLIQGLRDRSVEVRALARSDEAADTVAKLGAEPVRGDLSDVAVLKAGMAGCDVAFHAAAVVKLWGDPKYFHDVNVNGTEHVIEAARQAGVTRLVHVSTEALLAGGKPIVDADESWPYPDKPAGLYSLTKGLAEQRVLEANGDGLTTVAIRPPLIWGKGDTSVLPQIAAAVKNGQWMWFGDGHYLHTTTHVANVVEGLLLAAEKGRGGEVYFISDGEPRDFRDFITALLETQGVEAPTKTIPWGVANVLANVTEGIWRLFRIKRAPPLPRSLLYLMGQKLTVNDSKARNELGYQGRMTFEDGLAAMRGDAQEERAEA